MVERCRIRVEGPLAPYSAGFWAGLLSKGYTRLSAEKQMCLMAHLSRWLEGDALEASELTGQLADEFLEARRAEGYATYTSPKSLGAVLGYLRAFGAAPEPVVLVDRPSVDALVNGYVRYLADDRGLAPGTIAYYADRARVFLSSRPEPLVADLRRLTASEVTAYVMDGCGQGSVDSAKRLTTSLRSLLRFLFTKGWVAVELAPAVPTVAGWRASLPRGIEPGWVDRLLDSCDRDRVVGRRDYAILLLLSRLGLRAGRWPRSPWTTWVGGRASWPSPVARLADTTGCRCPPTSVRPWPTTCALLLAGTSTGRCSCESSPLRRG